MRSPAAAAVAADLVTGALDAADVVQAWTALLETLRRAFEADRVVLVQAPDDGPPVLVHAVPETTPGDVDPADFRVAFGAEDAIELGAGTILAVGLRPLDDHRWSIGLVRARPVWSAVERAALGDLHAHLELVLEHALLRAALDRTRERDERGEAEHERLLSVISHELRNPLAPILMWTSTLRRLRGDDPEVQRATAAIANAVNLERRLLEDLLDLSRLERGTIEVVMERVDLRDVARQAVDAHRRAATDAKLALDVDLPAAPVAVQGDATRLGQIVTALLENAVKFTPAGGRIAVTVATRGGQAVLLVADSGSGVPPEILPRLFTPFVQGTNARGGLGLGLAVARQLLALQRGTIEAASAADGGAAVVVTLPLVPA